MAETIPDLKGIQMKGHCKRTIHDHVLAHLMGSYCPGTLPVSELDTCCSRHVLFPT